MLKAEELEVQLDELMSRSEAYEGMDGEVLDLITRVAAIPGEIYTDNQCLWMIHQLVNKWYQLVNKWSELAD